MIRFLLYLFLAYFLWRVYRVVTAQRRGRRDDLSDAGGGSASRPDFSNVKDADFEELPPEPPSEGKPPER